MKKILILIPILLVFAGVFASVFCCDDKDTGQKKCWNIGECCDGEWYVSCCDFVITVSGPVSFRVGEKTSISVYVENIGIYPDSYIISAVSDNPLILVDMSDATEIENVYPRQSKKVHPRITVLSNTASGIVTFTVEAERKLNFGDQVTCEENGFIWASGECVNRKSYNFQVNGDDYLSLPEFSFYAMVGLMFASGVVLFLTKKQKI